MQYADNVYDIIVQAGQSNAEGYGRGDAEKVVLSDNVFRLESKKTVKIVKDVIFGENQLIEYDQDPFAIVEAQKFIDANDLCADFSITFADEYEKRFSEGGRKILVIRAAVGGSGFMKGQWGIGNILYEKLLESVDHALSLNDENRLAAFLWHQGEHDAFEKNPPAVFEKQLTDMLVALKNKFGDIPFIAADFCHDWTDRHINEIRPISQAVKKSFENIGGVFIESDGLSSNDQETMNADVIHFSRKAQYELGRRYFAAFKKRTENDLRN